MLEKENTINFAQKTASDKHFDDVKVEKAINYGKNELQTEKIQLLEKSTLMC